MHTIIAPDHCGWATHTKCNNHCGFWEYVFFSAFSELFNYRSQCGILHVLCISTDGLHIFVRIDFIIWMHTTQSLDRFFWYRIATVLYSNRQYGWMICTKINTCCCSLAVASCSFSCFLLIFLLLFFVSTDSFYFICFFLFKKKILVDFSLKLTDSLFKFWVFVF